MVNGGIYCFMSGNSCPRVRSTQSQTFARVPCCLSICHPVDLISKFETKGLWLSTNDIDDDPKNRCSRWLFKALLDVGERGFLSSVPFSSVPTFRYMIHHGISSFSGNCVRKRSRLDHTLASHYYRVGSHNPIWRSGKQWANIGACKLLHSLLAYAIIGYPLWRKPNSQQMGAFYIVWSCVWRCSISMLLLKESTRFASS